MTQKKLYIGNLPYSVTDDQLKELFSQAGTVESASIITDKFSGRSKGFGFVEMSTLEEAERAIDMFKSHEMDGRTMTVSEARPKEDGPRRSFGGGAGGGNRRPFRKFDDRGGRHDRDSYQN